MGLAFIKEAVVNLPSVMRGRTPGQLIIQTTDFCNATCPQCGMRKQEDFKRTRLDVDGMKRMIDRASKNGVKALSFTGGEPFLFQDDLFACIKYGHRKGIPYIRTGTNGFIFRNSGKPGFVDKMRKFAKELKKSGLYTFWISLDTWDIMEHEKNRGLDGVIDGIRTALLVFREEGVYPSANLGINRTIVKGKMSVTSHSSDTEKKAFYDAYVEGFRRFYEFAIGLGFTIANACYPMSMQGDAVYKAESVDDIVSYNDTEKHYLFKAMYDTLPEYRGRIRIFTPRSSLIMLVRHYGGEKDAGFACYGGIDYFFVESSTGHAFPCGFRAACDMGAYEDLDSRKIKHKPECRLCDWECFRDPSNQTGPLAEFFRNPFRVIRMFLGDREFMKEWWKDLLYYFACGMFNFTHEADYGKMLYFQKKNHAGKKKVISGEPSAAVSGH
ncbi:Radical SAM domain protein [Denitrovibrio acetiphilus DSM 12809]|uniref:Radical SAM domain protein n=1 Tax=Denitrovibrio acetiphilus (strain DSM 12809 / NBRC 114555 / N2460) TaxID=522772 RepID=D4H718_DENA2|nr:radical SAM protein [Denitrovibrio acetiphilus]ADD69722.1 Radical SAM domain protein [Denitrovibrio acetiphilus DSM 12809]